MDSSGKVRKIKSAVPVYKTVAQLSQRKRKKNDFSDGGDESVTMLLSTEKKPKKSDEYEGENDAGNFYGMNHLIVDCYKKCFLTHYSQTGIIEDVSIIIEDVSDEADKMRSSKERLENLDIELLYEPSEELTVDSSVHQTSLVSMADNHQRMLLDKACQDYVDVEYLEESSVISMPEHEGTSRCSNCEKCRR